MAGVSNASATFRHAYTDTAGDPQEFVSAAKYGYLFQGQYYHWQRQPRGTHGREQRAPEAEERVRLRVLDGVPDLVGADRRRRDRHSAEHLRREVHGAAARVVVVRERARCLLDRNLVEAVRIEDAAGNLGSRQAVGDGDLEVACKRAFDPMLGPEADSHRNDEREDEFHARIVAPAPEAAAQLELRWRSIRDRLVADGAGEPMLAALDEAFAEAPPSTGSAGRALVADGENVVVDEELPEPPPQQIARVSPQPYVLPLIELSRPVVPHVVVITDRTGADLVLLDLMLPGLSGTEVCRTLRQKSNVPVIMLTAKDSEIDKVVGLELGADDYVTKPFSSRELVARIRAVLRRRGEDEVVLPAALEAGPVRMDVERHVVTVRGDNVQLPLKEFELLEVLLRNAGRVLTRMQLIDRVWGADYVGDTKTLDVHVKRLRAKIEEDPGNPRYIVTVRGLGYKFEPVTVEVE